MPQSKTLILAHSDGDGLCSAAIALSAFPKASVFFTKPVSFLKDLQAEENRAEHYIVCDIALNKKDAAEIVNYVKENGLKLWWFDHHPIPESTSLQKIKSCFELAVHGEESASELAYKHFAEKIPEERVWPAIYGAISDYTENTEFVQTRLRDWDVRALYFEVSTLVLGIKMENFSGYDSKRKLVKILSEGKNPSDMPGLVQSAKTAVEREFELYKLIKKQAKVFGSIGYVDALPHFGFRGPAALFAATARNKPVGMAVFKRKGHLDITIRSRDPNINLNKLATLSAEKVNGSGGGHPQASGARIEEGQLQNFLQEANKILGGKN